MTTSKLDLHTLLVWTAVIGAAAPLSAQSAEPPIIDEAHQCDFREGPPAYRFSGAARASDNGWVLLEYDLDGSGRASNIKILEMRNAGTFTKEVIREINAAEFKKGVVKTKCREVISFVRR